MEERIAILDAIKQKFACGEVDIKTYSPLALAYMGDAIYDLVIRTVIVERANRSANKLHKAAVRYVNAGTQARMITVLEEELSEEEMAVYHRGRNAKSYTSAKNASAADYHKATGLEALFGYLYLQGRMDRLLTLTKRGLEKLEMDI